MTGAYRVKQHREKVHFDPTKIYIKNGGGGGGGGDNNEMTAPTNADAVAATAVNHFHEIIMCGLSAGIIETTIPYEASIN